MDENTKICISFARLPSRRIENSCSRRGKNERTDVSPNVNQKDTDYETDKDR